MKTLDAVALQAACNRPMFGALIAALLLSGISTEAISADNPYSASITNRNLFSLKDPPGPAPAPAPPPPNIPVVKLAGITTIMGGKRALLRVPRPAKPPAPVSEVSLMLSEGGAMEEGVRVLEINIAAGSVKIENQGTVQTLNIANDAPPSAPAAAPGAPGAPGLPIPGRNPAGAIPAPKAVSAPPPAGGGLTSIARPVRGAGPVGEAGANAVQGSGLIGAGPTGVPEPPPPPTFTVDEQMVLIELERDRTRAAVEAGDLPPLPPTDFSEAGEQQGGLPTPTM